MPGKASIKYAGERKGLRTPLAIKFLRIYEKRMELWGRVEFFSV